MTVQSNILLVLSVFALSLQLGQSKAPNILFIMADDLGWNDISLHGSSQIPTPNIDALAAGGIQLDSYYANPDCSPARSSLLTGRHAIHTGVFKAYNYRTRNGHLNTSYTLLPAYLKSCCNYSTHIIGKWHLGLSTIETLPTSRGFDTHFGYWLGVEDHIRHRTYGAYDYNDQLRIATELNGTWSTPTFTSKAIEIFETAKTSDQPFFLYLSFQDVHWPVQAPDSFIEQFANSTGGDRIRQRVCAMAAHLDEAVGNVTAALRSAGLEEDTLIVFSSDNGGPTNKDEMTSSNNYPLRGGKSTLWEGGNRVVGIVKGAGITNAGSISTDKMHMSDWLPTLVAMATGSDNWEKYIPAGEAPFLLGDGVNMWPSLSQGVKSARDWILLETHPTEAAERYHGDALIVNQWKIVRYVDSTSNKIQNGWHAPRGQDPSVTPYTVQCGGDPPLKVNRTECIAEYCLFDLSSDPCEFHDVARRHPEVVQMMLTRLKAFQDTAVDKISVEGYLPLVVTLDSGSRVWQPCDINGFNEESCKYPEDVGKGTHNSEDLNDLMQEEYFNFVADVQGEVLLYDKEREMFVV